MHLPTGAGRVVVVVTVVVVVVGLVVVVVVVVVVDAVLDEEELEEVDVDKVEAALPGLVLGAEIDIE